MLGSEERYLWLCEYHIHEENRLWWAYFQDQQEVDTFFAQMLGLFACLSLKKLEEQKIGISIAGDYYHHRLSCHLRALEQAQEHRARHSRFAPLAPVEADFLTSFVLALGKKYHSCLWCAAFAPCVAEIFVAKRRKRRSSDNSR